MTTTGTNADPPRGKINTPLGPVDYQWNDANTCCLGVGRNEDSRIEIRGTPYSFTFHVKRSGEPGAKWERWSYQYPHVTRLGSYGKPPSQACIRQIHDAVLESWQRFADKHPDLARRAERADLQRQIESLKGSIADKREMIASYERQIESLRARQDAV
jgi:hypothetical protein